MTAAAAKPALERQTLDTVIGVSAAANPRVNLLL
jgi:hypothetical protein